MKQHFSIRNLLVNGIIAPVWRGVAADHNDSARLNQHTGDEPGSDDSFAQGVAAYAKSQAI